MKALLILLLCCSWLPAQHMGNFNDQANDMHLSRANIATGNPQHSGYVAVPNLNVSTTLTHTVRALYNVGATHYTAVFNINQIGKTASQTTQLMNDKIDAIKRELTANGFKGEFAVDMITFLPQYEIEVTRKLFSKTYTEIPVGFELQQNLMISYSEDSDFQKILSACAAAEVYNLVKVDYYVKNLEAIYAELQVKILAEVSQKKEYYTALGFDMDNYDVMMADQKYYHLPKDFYKSYQAAENISMEVLDGKKNVNAIKKPVSYYYDPIPYSGYDLVVNAEISKPMIQLGMDLRLQYVVKPEKPKPVPQPQPVQKPEPKVYVISPSGKIDIKQLPDS